MGEETRLNKPQGGINMVRIIAILLISLGLLFGCATGPPVKNPQFTESNLPKQYRIEGIKPIKDNLGIMNWQTCVDMVLNFYGRPLGKETKDKAMAINIATQISFGQVPYPTSPGDYYPTALKLHGFKRYSLYDQSPDGAKIKYFLAQGHPVIARPGLLTGYDDEKEIFFVCDAKLGEAIEIPYKDFPRRRAIEWADTSKLVRSGEIIYPKK